MSTLTFFTVTGNYFAALADSYDADTDPDLVPMSGTITFTPLVDGGDVIKAETLDPPTNLLLKPVEGIVRSGQVWMSANAGVRLVANTDVLGLSGDLYYRVDFPDGLTARGKNYQLNTFTFLAPVTDTTVDLVEVTPLPGNPAVGEVLPVVSVAGKTGAIILVAADISNATTIGKAVLTAADTAAARAALEIGNQEAEYETNLAAFPATGDATKEYIAEDTGKIYRWNGSAYVELSAGQPVNADLTAIAGLTPSNDDVIQRKAGAWTNRTPAQLKTDLALAKDDVGLSNVDNTSDANKPVSTAQQTALNLKAPLASPTFTGTVSGVTKTMVGLGNVDNTADTAKPVSTAQAAAISADRAADYVVSIVGANYVATPANPLFTTYSGTNFTTVLQNAVNALTPAGSVGSGGGKIHICSGSYTMGNQVTITGWEGIVGLGNPLSQLIIEGEGYATKITQNTSGQHAFVVLNNACVSFVDMFGSVGSSAKSFIFGDKTGAQSESSFTGGTLRLAVFSTSTTDAPIHLKNFMDVKAPELLVQSSAYHAIVLENDSTVTQYGNSHFGYVRAKAPSTSTWAGLVLQSNNASHPLNLVSFDNYECLSTSRGIYINGAWNMGFGFVDIEACGTCIYLDGTLGGIQTESTVVNAGYLQPANAGTGILNAAGSGGNNIRVRIETGAGSVVPVNDSMEWLPFNSYDLTMASATDTAAMVFTNAAKQNLMVRCFDQSYVRRFPDADGTKTTLTVGSVPLQVAPATHAATGKTTPVDADELALVDSAASNGLKKLTWANLKATLKTYFDSLTTTFTNKTIDGNGNTVTSVSGLLKPVRCAAQGGSTYTIVGGSVTQIAGTTVDGQSPAVGERILIWMAPAATGVGTDWTPTTNPANGIYRVTGTTTNLTLVRDSDMTGAAHPSALCVYVETGTWGGQLFTVTSPSTAGSAFTYGTTGMGWGQLLLSALTGNTTTTLTAGTLELGNASDTTLSRSAAGQLAVEGVDVLTTSNTKTATNKTFTSPTFTTPVLGTPTSGTLTNCTGLPVAGITASTATALGVGSIELGHATDTTVSRSAAGVIAVEGVDVATRAVSTTTSSATPTVAVTAPNMQYTVTALAAGATFGAPTGSPADGWKLTIRVKDNGTARSLAFNAIFRAIGVTLPTTTVISKTLYIGCIYNSADTKWDVVAVGQEA